MNFPEKTATINNLQELKQAAEQRSITWGVLKGSAALSLFKVPTMTALSELRPAFDYNCWSSSPRSILKRHRTPNRASTTTFTRQSRPSAKKEAYPQRLKKGRGGWWSRNTRSSAVHWHWSSSWLTMGGIDSTCPKRASSQITTGSCFQRARLSSPLSTESKRLQPVLLLRYAFISEE